MERDEIQKRLASKFPITKTKFLVQAVLKDPEVTLRRSDDRIGLTISVVVTPPFLEKEFPGTVTALGRLDYNRDEKSFYLRDAEIENLAIQGVPRHYAEKVRGACEEIAKIELARTPVYKLGDRNLKEVAASFVLRAVRVKDGALEAELGPPISD